MRPNTGYILAFLLGYWPMPFSLKTIQSTKFRNHKIFKHLNRTRLNKLPYFPNFRPLNFLIFPFFGFQTSLFSRFFYLWPMHHTIRPSNHLGRKMR